MAKILETLLIQHMKDLNWFNGPIINILMHVRLNIKVLFPNDFCQYLTEMENKIKQLLLVNKLNISLKKHTRSEQQLRYRNDQD